MSARRVSWRSPKAHPYSGSGYHPKDRRPSALDWRCNKRRPVHSDGPSCRRTRRARPQNQAGRSLIRRCVWHDLEVLWTQGCRWAFRFSDCYVTLPSSREIRADSTLKRNGCGPGIRQVANAKILAEFPDAVSIGTREKDLLLLEEVFAPYA
jgi:hypothetical protein